MAGLFELIGNRLELANLKTKEATRQTINQGRVREAAKESYQETPVTQTTEEGMTVNLGTKKEFDPELFASNLEAIDPAIATQWRDSQTAQRKAQLEYETSKQKASLNSQIMGMDLIKAGKKAEGLAVINQHAPKGQRVLDVVPGKNGKWIEVNEDGTKDEFHPEQVRKASLDSASRLNYEMQTGWARPTYEPNTGIISQTNRITGKTDVLAKLDTSDPRAGKASEKISELIDKEQALQARGDLIKDATKEFSTFSANTLAGTGMHYSFSSEKAISEEAAALESKFQTLNIDELVSTFQGMSKTIDSDAERAALGKKQPTIKNDDKVNAKILTGMEVMRVKILAETAARKVHLEKNMDERGYRSPIAGKQSVLFKDGQAELVPNEEITKLKKQGYLDPDEYAQDLISTNKRSSPVVHGGYTFPNKKALDAYLKATGKK